MVSSPAIMRSKVDLPQPDGPTSTTNSPSTMSRSTPWITSTAPNVLRTPRMVTWAILAPHTHAIDLKPELPDQRTEVYPEPTGRNQLGGTSQIPVYFATALDTRLLCR